MSRSAPAPSPALAPALAAPRRPTCPRCLRPQAACLCPLVRPTAHRTPVLVLQHPQEQRQAKNSVALLRLSLAHCEVVVGERFASDVLARLLHGTGPGPRHDVRLLYPDVPAAPAPAGSTRASPSVIERAIAPPAASPSASPSASARSPTPVPAAPPLRLVVIDATWRKSLRLLLEHPALAALPRLSLPAPPPTRYRAIRAARRSDQVSTLEATVQALAALEGPSFDGAPLLDAFDRFVAAVAARRQPRGSAG